MFYLYVLVELKYRPTEQRQGSLSILPTNFGHLEVQFHSRTWGTHLCEQIAGSVCTTKNRSFLHQRQSSLWLLEYIKDHNISEHLPPLGAREPSPRHR